MSLVDDLGAVTRAPYRRCALSQWLETRTADEVAAVRAAIADANKPIREVAKILSANGHTISAATIGNHRNNECVTCHSQTS